MRIIGTLLVIAVLALAFFTGGYIGQATFKPQVITKTETEYKVVEKIVYEPVETVVVKEVLLKLRNFSSLEELEGWLEKTGIQVQFGSNMLDCDNYALGLQQRALKDGYLMSFEAIWADEYNKLFKVKQLTSGELHAINLVIIGNDVYYIEPQTHEVVLAGRLD